MWDQHYRLKPNGYVDYRDSITYVDHKNADFLKQMHNRFNGFPDEYIIGIDTFDIQNPLYHILLYHQSFGMFGTKQCFAPEIKDAILSGRLNNSTGGELLEKALDRYPLGNNFIITSVYDSLGMYSKKSPDNLKNIPSHQICNGHKKLSDSEKGKINENRAAIYLETLQALLDKKEANDIGKGLPLWYSMQNVYYWAKKEDFDYACGQLEKGD